MKKIFLLLTPIVLFTNLHTQEEYGEFLDNAIEAAAKYDVKNYNINLKYFVTALERDKVTPETLPEIFYDKYLQCISTAFIYEINLSEEFKQTVLEFAEYGAEKQNADAMYILGFLYNDRRSVPKDEEKSAHWYQKAADNGNPDAMDVIAAYYREGAFGFKNDAKKAKYWSDKALEIFMERAKTENEQNDLTLLGIGSHYLALQNYEEAKKWFKKLADRENIMGLSYMAFSYMAQAWYNNGGTEELDQSISWARKAAEKGQPTGMMALGILMYLKGDREEALEWLEKSCNLGNQMGCEMYGAFKGK